MPPASTNQQRAEKSNPLIIRLVLGSLVILVCGLLMFWPNEPSEDADDASELFMYCAAGMRPAVEQIVNDYRRELGVSIRVQYGGSNTLLSQIEVSKTGDIYLAADESYVDLAGEKNLIDEQLSVAKMFPVIGVATGNPKRIHKLNDLLRQDVRVALGNPDQAAIGRRTRSVFEDLGMWRQLKNHVARHGVLKPTVNDVANDIKLGSVDAGIIWSATSAQYPEIETVRSNSLDAASTLVTVGILTRSEAPTAALRFARYLTAKDRGLVHFADYHFEPINGDLWAVTPELTFYAGSVNRRAVEPIIERFSNREGATINTVFNGCGILTAQMKSMRQQNESSGFPDVYMACDVYYLDVVADLFHDGVRVSNTDIVIVVQKGNPLGIRSLADLVRPGTRVAIGQPDQCTIGVLSRRLLQREGLYDQLLRDNVVTQTPTSALLVPNVTTGAVDAVLAYRTDTLAEQDKLGVVEIESELARAVQPFSVSRSSQHQHLAKRLFDAIAESQLDFENAGFNWQLAPVTNGD